MHKRKCTGANCPMQVGYVVPETCPEPEKCRYATFPQTNGDRIRAMTDEELANSEFAPIICDMVPAEWCYMGRSCYECRLAWLRSPVEESHE